VPHIKVAAVASRWHSVRDLIVSGSERDIFRTSGRHLTTCATRPVGRFAIIIIHQNAGIWPKVTASRGMNALHMN